MARFFQKNKQRTGRSCTKPSSDSVVKSEQPAKSVTKTPLASADSTVADSTVGTPESVYEAYDAAETVVVETETESETEATGAVTTGANPQLLVGGEPDFPLDEAMAIVLAAELADELDAEDVHNEHAIQEKAADELMYDKVLEDESTDAGDCDEDDVSEEEDDDDHVCEAEAEVCQPDVCETEDDVKSEASHDSMIGRIRTSISNLQKRVESLDGVLKRASSLVTSAEAKATSALSALKCCGATDVINDDLNH